MQIDLLIMCIVQYCVYIRIEDGGYFYLGFASLQIINNKTAILIKINQL